MTQSSFNGFTAPKKDKGAAQLPYIDVFKKAPNNTTLLDVGTLYNVSPGFGCEKPLASDGSYYYSLNGSGYIYKYDLNNLNFGQHIAATSAPVASTPFAQSGLYCFGGFLYYFKGTSANSNYYIVSKDLTSFLTKTLSGSSDAIYTFNYFQNIMYINGFVYVISTDGVTSNHICKYSIGLDGTLNLISDTLLTFASTAGTSNVNVGVDYSKSLNAICLFNAREIAKVYTYNLDTGNITTISLSNTATAQVTNGSIYMQFYCCGVGNFIFQYASSANASDCVYSYFKTDGSLIRQDTYSQGVAAYLGLNRTVVTKYGFYFSNSSISKFILNSSGTIINQRTGIGVLNNNYVNSMAIPYHAQLNGVFIQYDGGYTATASYETIKIT